MVDLLNNSGHYCLFDNRTTMINMVFLNYLVSPLLGGIIGYITNDVAIRMLFRPRTAKYIFGWQIPFTPGIIPKGKSRLADAIGQVISQNLMSQEVLEGHLLSDEMVGKVRSAVENFFEEHKTNEETVRVFIGHYLTTDEVESIVSNINNSLTNQMQSRLSEPAVGNKVAELAMNYVSNKLNSEGTKVLLGGLGGMMGGIPGMFAGPVITRLLEMLREPAQNFLADNINTMLRDNGTEIVSNMVGDEVTSFLDKKVCVLLEGHDEQLAQVVNTVENLYRTIIKEHLPRILASVDISKIVHDRIMEMDVKETEKMVLAMMSKELGAIVWLGALLGVIMGSINIVL